MKIEEAKARLEMLRQQYEGVLPIKQAINMGIDALTYQNLTKPNNTCEVDLISRKDVMGAVQDHFNAYGFKGYYDGQKMMDRITALPSVEAEWIPCSERLPKPDEEVFVYLWGDVPQLASVNGEGQWKTDNFYLDADDSPKAWMPLPKPYREDGER